MQAEQKAQQKFRQEYPGYAEILRKAEEENKKSNK